MFNIADYFRKFSKIEGDSLFEKDSIKAAIYEVCGMDKVDFEIKKGIVYIKGSPMVKSLIFTKKGALLSAIKIKLPQKTIFDVR